MPIAEFRRSFLEIFDAFRQKLVGLKKLRIAVFDAGLVINFVHGETCTRAFPVDVVPQHSLGVRRDI